MEGWKRSLTLGLVTGVLGACSNASPPAHGEAGTLNQAAICEVRQWQHDVVAAACKPGQKVAFLPETFGNEQLPVLFAAVNCDLRYTVALTTGGVTCIYVGPLAPDTKSEPQK
ncbi:hypothetical protein [Dyella sp. C9]|uniref:hypothetical protein n=1 Tax=Dyella sp. C9 TaxID=2202154 RepID=UPI000DEF8DD2|nr:hypothetical protein [Dyella sp. C9]